MTVEATRVFFLVERASPNVEPQVGVEGLWAEKVGPDLYRLLNIPFLAKGYAWGDVVRCDEVKDRLYAVETVSHSGSSTIRLLFREPTSDETVRTVSYLQYLGCTYESSRNLFAFDVPPEPTLKVSLPELAAYLNEISHESDSLDWETAKWLSKTDPNTAW